MSLRRCFDETILNMVPSQNHTPYRYLELLRSQSLNPPAPRLAPVDETVMHPVLPALPELDYARVQHVTAPMSRARHFRIAKLLRRLIETPFKVVALDRLALRRDGGGDLAVPRPTREVGVRLRGREPRDLTPDANLPIELAPVDDQCSPSAGRQLLALGALVVAEEAEPVGPESLEQHHPAVGRAFGIDRREGHRLGQRHNRQGLLEPLGELLQRLLRQMLAIEGRVFRATRTHPSLESPEEVETSTTRVERMPGASVGAPASARTAEEKEGRQ